MKRIVVVAVGAAAGFMHAQPIRWVPDQLDGGATETYIPDGMDCQEYGGSSGFYCWPSGTRPPADAALIHGPRYTAAPVQPAPQAAPALSSAARTALEEAAHALRTAAMDADRARHTGQPGDVQAAADQTTLAERQIRNAIREIHNPKDVP